MHKAKLSALVAGLIASTGAFAFGPQIDLDSAVIIADSLKTHAPRQALDIEIGSFDIEVAPGAIAAANVVANDKRISSSVEIDNVKEITSSSAKVEIKTDDGKLSASSKAEAETNGGDATANATANVDMAAVVAAVKSSVSSTAIGAMNTGDITVSAAQNYAYGSLEFSTGGDSIGGKAAIGFAFGTNVDAFNVVSNQGDVTSEIEISGISGSRDRHGFGFNAAQGVSLNGVDINSVAMGAVNTGSISVTTTGVNLVGGRGGR